MRTSPFAFLLVALISAGCAKTTNHTVLMSTASHPLTAGPRVLGDASSSLVQAEHDFALTLRIAIDAKDLPRPP